MVPDINYLAVVLATVAAIVIGSVWYNPKVLGTVWMKLARIENRPSSRAAAVRPIAISIAMAFVTAWVLAGSTFISQEFYGGDYLGNALVTGLVLFVGFTAARILTHDGFESRPGRLTILNLTHELLVLLALALVIGLLPPA